MSGNLKVVGIILAICSGLLIGSSFVFKKKGLLRSQAGQVAGEGVAYLKSPLWWTGMIMMILGELCNFAAYAFVEAIVVTPLGALSVVICAILSSIFLKEALTFFGWMGCALCIIGSTIIALNGPQEATVGEIVQFQALFLAPGFLSYAGTLIVASLVIIFYFAPRYGTKSMLWYIFVCSMIGGISVSVTTGLGAAIVTTAQGNNQFTHWFIYFLIGFVAVTLITEVYYLNRALALFNTAMVTPTYYVIFTFFSMVTTIVLFQGLKSTVPQILTVVLAFLTICVGITILQMSKVDPEQLTLGKNKLDRRSTILLQAARARTENSMLEEKGNLTGLEDPGIDTLRGSFGAVGSIIRARSARRLSMRSSNVSTREPWIAERGVQLYDAPVPPPPPLSDAATRDSFSESGSITPKKPTIKFTSSDIIHSYHPPGQTKGEKIDPNAVHEYRPAGYPPGRQPSTSSSDSRLPIIPPPPRTSSKLSTTTTRDFLDNDTDEGTQSVALPSSIRAEHQVHSAPPRILSTASSGSGITFPSITDSAFSYSPPSSEGGVPSSPEEDRNTLRDRDRGRSRARYPKAKGGEDIDKEESVSLFSERERQREREKAGAGIRLVTNSNSRESPGKF